MEPKPKTLHSYNRACPACGGGFCKFAQVNSLTPYEELDAEMKRTRPGFHTKENDAPTIYSRKKFK